VEADPRMLAASAHLFVVPRKPLDKQTSPPGHGRVGDSVAIQVMNLFFSCASLRHECADRVGTTPFAADPASRLSHVLLNASGCLDALTAPDVARALDAFVTKTVTPEPREGNAPVRIAETDVGMLNSIGLANPGIDIFLTRSLPQLGKLGVPIWVSVGGFEADDYARICSRLDDHEEVAAIELNVSCPNVESPVEGAAQIVASARLATRKPLWAKLSAAVPDLTEVARAAQEAGADGLSLINTLRGLALDERTLQPILGPVIGGLSGPALKPIALASVFACHRAVDLPIAAMGGVRTGRDVLELVAAGARHVALGTILFSDPDAPTRVRGEVASELAARRYANIDEAYATAHAKSLSTAAT
jgi:dihydroorotate dehydrogenase (NAD+) catalytic subunit